MTKTVCDSLFRQMNKRTPSRLGGREVGGKVGR